MANETKKIVDLEATTAITDSDLIIVQPADGETKKMTYNALTDELKTNLGVPFKFGVDEQGNYGYVKEGADTVTPFSDKHFQVDSLIINNASRFDCKTPSLYLVDDNYPAFLESNVQLLSLYSYNEEDNPKNISFTQSTPKYLNYRYEFNASTCQAYSPSFLAMDVL